MNDILLSGYYGFGNAGDEAILEAAVSAFQKRGLKVGVLSHEPQNTSKRLKITAFERTGLGSLWDAVRSSRLVLSGGGGLFQDTTSLRSLIYYLRIPFLAKMLGKKTMIFAQGIGPIRSSLGKKLTTWVCDRFIDRIAVRDNPSKQLLRAFGVKQDVEVTADLAFLGPAPSKEEREMIRDRFHLGDSRFLGVVLRQWPTIEKDLPSLAKAISDFCMKRDSPPNGDSPSFRVTPVLIPFQPGSDQTVLRSLRDRLKIPSIEISESLSWRELSALLSNLDFVIGMRYHALLFSACVSVPFLGIAYDDKVSHLANSLQSPSISLDQVSSGGFSAALERAWEEREELQKRLRPRAAEWTGKAERNIEIAIQLLGSVVS